MGLQSTGFYNLPQMANPGTTGEFAYVVPAAGLYAGLPSPAQFAGNDLVIPASTQGVPVVGYGTTPPTNTVVGGPFDSIPFGIKVSGRYNSHSTQNLTIKIYQITAANIAAWTTSTGNTTTNLNLIYSSGALAAGNNTKNNFMAACTALWDNGSQKLGAVAGATLVGGTIIASGQQTTQTQVASVGYADLNFVVTFLFSAGTAADWVTPYQFVIDSKAGQVDGAATGVALCPNIRISVRFPDNKFSWVAQIGRASLC